MEINKKNLSLKHARVKSDKIFVKNFNNSTSLFKITLHTYEIKYCVLQMINMILLLKVTFKLFKIGKTC